MRTRSQAQFRFGRRQIPLDEHRRLMSPFEGRAGLFARPATVPSDHCPLGDNGVTVGRADRDLEEPGFHVVKGETT